MEGKYKNKYRISSSRLSGYDYSQNGMYFVTICTRDREHYFGVIENGEMCLSEIGKIVNNFCLEIPIYFLFVRLDEFVVMPNHVHIILQICANDVFVGRDAINRVSTDTNNKTGGITGEHNPMNHSQSLSKIIRWFKGRCSFEINKNICPVNFYWQSRFYDHVIRNEESLNKIREYIRCNPKMWELDRNNLENLLM